MKFLKIGLIVSAIFVSACCVKGDEVLLECENRTFKTDGQYYNCVLARELVIMRKMLEVSEGSGCP